MVRFVLLNDVIVNQEKKKLVVMNTFTQPKSITVISLLTNYKLKFI